LDPPAACGVVGGYGNVQEELSMLYNKLWFTELMCTYVTKDVKMIIPAKEGR
jgi:hypothetical protein